MKKIIVLGAGLSSTYLIQYLEQHKDTLDIALSIADQNMDAMRSKVNHNETDCIVADLTNPQVLTDLISNKQLVVSMLPARMHAQVAHICLKEGVNLATASYLSDELKAMDQQVKDKGLVFLNECGLDPGIDHLSAMHLLDRIRDNGGKITEFESFTGGLLAPDSEDNPWRYKFTWNPRNVVLASQGGAVKFLHNGKYKYIPYHRVFRRTEIVEIEGYGKFEGYANRDSLKYRDTYGLQHVRTMYRGTFRRPGFSKAWNCLVQLGTTDDSYVIEHSDQLTHRDFINSFLAYHPTDSVELKLKQYLGIAQDDVDLWEKLEYLGLFTDEPVLISKGTPAQILQHMLEKKWSLKPQDRDMIVMWHRVNYEQNGEYREVQSSLVVEGEDQQRTAMAMTVGLPLAISCKLMLAGRIQEKGCILPIHPEIYQAVLHELADYGIRFKETH